MDVVYILGSGSKWGNNELRYSLRSLERHFKHGKVFIVGERPDWLQNIIHIKVEDSFANVHGGKYKNVMRKTIAACQDERVSESFVLMNDDFFFLQDTETIPPYTLGTLQEQIDKYRSNNRNQYGNALLRTKRLLETYGIKDAPSYAVHYPIVYDKQKFLQMTEEINWLEKPCSWRTLYGNLFSIGSVERKDPKANNEEDLEEFFNIELDFISISDGVAQLPVFQKWLQERFPEPSMYEH